MQSGDDVCCLSLCLSKSAEWIEVMFGVEMLRWGTTHFVLEGSAIRELVSVGTFCPL